jgi:hypothetical protein
MRRVHVPIVSAVLCGALSIAGARAQEAASFGDCAVVGAVTRDGDTIPAIMRPGLGHWDPGVIAPLPWSPGKAALPDHPTAILVRLRVGTDGRTSAVCITGAIGRPVAESMIGFYERNWSFFPATKHSRPVPVTLEYSFLLRRTPTLEAVLAQQKSSAAWSDRNRRNPLFLYASNDVAWLERFAETGQAPEDPRNPRSSPLDVGWRGAALARLGELATPESLAAVDRVVAAAATVGPGTEPLTAADALQPSGFVSERRVGLVAVATASDGTTYRVVHDDLYGRSELFVSASRTSDVPAAWTRPRLTPFATAGLVSEGSAKWHDRTLEVTFGETDARRSPPAPPNTPRTRTVTIDLVEVWRDSDHDGLTDLEEQRIGLDPQRADTDGDGLVDGSDTCPLFAAPTNSPHDGTFELVQAAFFATFGVTRDRRRLEVRPGMPQIGFVGYLGPVMYGGTPPAWTGTYGEEAAGRLPWFAWEVVDRTGDSAVVIITTWMGPMASTGTNIYLKKMRGRWYVVAHQTAWKS